MKCWILSPGENWIVDEMARQFKRDNQNICTDNIAEADIVWAMADWCFFEKLSYSQIVGKSIVMMLHHFVPEKFDQRVHDYFVERDKFVTIYTVPNFRTRDFVLERKLTTKPIHVVPYWVDTQTWKKTGEKLELRRKYELPEEAFMIGSFQRDTEGRDLKSPKLEKGPDLFADFVIKKFEEWKKLRKVVIGEPLQPFVVLAGWRRQYVIKRFEEAGVPYKYFELPSQEVINDLYQALDLYPVCSRYEGGPQALLETAVLEVPCISTPVGMAEIILAPESVNVDLTKAITNTAHSKSIVKDLLVPGQGYEKHIEILRSACKK